MNNTLAPQKQTVTTHSFCTKHFQIGIITENKQENLLLVKTIEAACALGFMVSMVMPQNREAQKQLIDLSEQYNGQFELFEFSGDNEKRIIRKSNVVLFLDKPNQEKLKRVMKKGIVPIVPFGNTVQNFDAQKETGTGFCFTENNFYECLAMLVRAFETYKFPYDWNNLRKATKKFVN